MRNFFHLHSPNWEERRTADNRIPSSPLAKTERLDSFGSIVGQLKSRSAMHRRFFKLVTHYFSHCSLFLFILSEKSLTSDKLWYQVTFALTVIQLRSALSFSLKSTSPIQKIRASQFSLPASILVSNNEVRQLGDRYSQSTAVSFAIVAVELLSCLHLQSASPFVGTILPVYSTALFSSRVLR